MIIETITSGQVQTNCFVVGCKPTRLAFVIDPADDIEAVCRVLETNNLTPLAMIMTHGHFDHLEGNARLREQFPELPIYCHPGDAEMLTSSMRNMSSLFFRAVKSPPSTHTLEDGGLLALGESVFDVIHLPGHSPGSICLYCADEGVVFSGDTLFCEGVGRTDFPGADMDLLQAGIREKLFTLPQETVVYPGHGPSTTIGHEKLANPFIK